VKRIVTIVSSAFRALAYGSANDPRGPARNGAASVRERTERNV